VVVELRRDVDEEELKDDELEDLGKVFSAFFPGDKKESWWLVIGDMSNNTLMSLKRVSFRAKQSFALEFLAPEQAGDYDLTLFCMCDSYLGCDQEIKLSLSVAAADSDDDNDASESDNE
jgi:pre-mRNA-splicing helicase BRR2